MTTRLLLIRHGETDWNAQGRYQGQTDPPLNRRGEEQAQRLAEKLAGDRLDMAYSSPLRRAVQTARIIAESLTIPLHIEPRLMEIHLGAWESLLATEIAARDPERFRGWEKDPWGITPPDGESIKSVRDRVYAAADEILVRHAGRSIGLVAHQLPLVLLKIRYQGIDPALVRKVSLPNTHWEEIEIVVG